MEKTDKFDVTPGIAQIPGVRSLGRQNLDHGA